VSASSFGSGYSNGGGRYKYSRMSEINVTPFVDVMLVLLIVFMVTAPLMTVGVPVDLPRTKAAMITDTEEPLVISVDAEGVIYIQDTPVPLEKLAARLIAITGSNPEIRIFVRGDKSIDYGTVLMVMGRVNAAGFKKVSLLAKLPDQGRTAK
jgi:biopolymer transport protein TolR